MYYITIPVVISLRYHTTGFKYYSPKDEKNFTTQIRIKEGQRNYSKDIDRIVIYLNGSSF
jgi:hypothetical protein